MSVIIGIDPHKRLHAAYAIDVGERELAAVTVRSGARQVPELLRWAGSFDDRRWAIESANGLGYLLAQQLVAAGEHVVDVPSTLSARVRTLSSGKSTKNDSNDARAVAVAALHAPSLTVVRGEDHVSVRACSRSRSSICPAPRAGPVAGSMPSLRIWCRVGCARKSL